MMMICSHWELNLGTCLYYKRIRSCLTLILFLLLILETSFRDMTLLANKEVNLCNFKLMLAIIF